MPPALSVLDRAADPAHAVADLRPLLARAGSGWVFADAEHGPYRLSVAADRASRERACRLAQRVYHARGFVGSPDGLHVAAYDAAPSTCTLVVDDAAGEAVATITEVFDDGGLPCDELYAAEVAALRAAGRRLVEVCRLCVAETHQHARVLLARLLNAAYINAVRVRDCDDLLIEVNPRHVSWYRRALLFETIGPERPCPRVAGAPAVLLRCRAERFLRNTPRPGRTTDPRLLYAQFYRTLEEGALAEALATQHRPLGPDELRALGVAPGDAGNGAAP